MSRPRDEGAEARILDAAAQRMARGERSWTLSSLAEEAGVSRASLYRRFGSREQLLARLVAERGIRVPAEEPKDTRAAVLDAFECLLEERGLRAVTLEQVAARAEVGRVTVYRHFGDRRGLLDAFIAERTPRRLSVRLRLCEGEDLAGELLALVRVGLRFISRHRGLVRLALSPDPEAQELLAELMRAPGTTRSALKKCLEYHSKRGTIDGDPERMVLLLVGAVAAHGLLYPSQDEEEIERSARFIVRTFIRGVATDHQARTQNDE
ncbi:MAG TPA: TetR/AcrR family transcriptional regulator [Nannocystis exedens]|nr:TetR/AcrR family transcriptional regulator [Nannocystis exedens]